MAQVISKDGTNIVYDEEYLAQHPVRDCFLNTPWHMAAKDFTNKTERQLLFSVVSVIFVYKTR